MKLPRPLTASLALAFGIAPFPARAAHPNPGKESAPILVKLDEAASSPFSQGLFGTQEEVPSLPNLSADYWKAARENGVSLLRYPCGTPSDWFAWDNPEKGYWPPGFYKKSKKMHPDAYIALCRRTGITPLITVNTGSWGAPTEKKRINPTRGESIQKGADYAAAWVRDFNVKKKYGVKYWEIGNEVWVWLKADEYPDFAKRYSAAMKAVDPTIKIIACGLEYTRRPFYPTWLNFPDDPDWVPRKVVHNDPFEWNQRLLKDAKGAFDYLALHIYLNGDSIDPVQNTLENFSKVAICPQLERAVRQIRESGEPVRLAITEWTVNFRWDPLYKKYFFGPKMNYPEMAGLTRENSPFFNFGSLLVAADFMGRLASTGMVDIAVVHTLQNTILCNWNHELKKGINPPVEMPTGAAMRFWHDFSGDSVVPVELPDVPATVFRSLRFPLVSAYASEKKGGPLYLILINRSPEKSFRLALPAEFAGKAVTKAVEHTISAKSWGESMYSSLDHPEAYPFVRADREMAPTELKEYLLPPNRLTCVELRN